jgi:hypothetical protein
MALAIEPSTGTIEPSTWPWKVSGLITEPESSASVNLPILTYRPSGLASRQGRGEAEASNAPHLDGVGLVGRVARLVAGREEISEEKAPGTARAGGPWS